MNIYQITGNYLQLQQLIEQGELDEQLLNDTLEAVQGELEVKCENLALVMTNLENLSTGLKTEATRLLERQKQVDNNINWIKKSLLDMMIATDSTKFKTDHFTFSTRTSEAVNIINPHAIPEAYVRTKVVQEPDKIEIKKALKAGEEVPGATIKNNISLVIK
jgi:hypothetical protein